VTACSVRRVGSIAAGCLLALCACGGPTATRQDVIARGNAICLSTLRALRALPPSSGTGEAALRDYLRRAIPLVEKEVIQLGTLPRPPRDRAVLEGYLAAVREAGGDYRRLATAARSGDPADVTAALSALRANPAGTLARRYGLDDCASAAIGSNP